MEKETMSTVNPSDYILPLDSELVLLECRAAFEALTPKQRQYAHHFGQASWNGALACLFQTSPESPAIFVLLQKLFRKQSVVDLKKSVLANGLTDKHFQAFMMYVGGFYGNLGNYKAFGYTKIIPGVSLEEFEKIVKLSAAYKENPKEMGALWDKVAPRICSLLPRQLQLGLGNKGISAYYSDNCDVSDAEIAQEFMTEKNLSALNTRLFKEEEGGKVTYEVRLASSLESAVSGDGLFGSHDFTSRGKTVTIKVTRGDYGPLMQRLADHLAKAKEYAANEVERKMLEEYIRSFTEGSIEAHKEGTRHWIANKGPVIETYIGFIETYQDPFGVRGEYEGFVAMVNKEKSALFARLVDNAERFLPLLPWPSAYEQDKFFQPDFTSLDVLYFASSFIWSGINLPDYYDIRQSYGFKNVSLGNVVALHNKGSKITFLAEEDKALCSQMLAASFEVQVALHELLGHGSGKLFIKNADGSFNFDRNRVHDLETGQRITSWYEDKETWKTKFASLCCPYEECRSECVGIYLCLSPEVLKIFGHEGSTAADVIYINWLLMVRLGVLSLEFYSPETQKWRQAHMQGRFVILRVLLEAGEGLVSIEKTTGDDGKPDLIIRLDRTKINTVGKKAIGEFLKKLQLYKTTGDVKKGTAMFERYSTVTDDVNPHFLSLRPVVLDRKLPRKTFIQCNTVVKGEDVELVEYENVPEGMVRSFQERFSEDVDDILLQLAEKDAKWFP